MLRKLPFAVPWTNVFVFLAMAFLLSFTGVVSFNHLESLYLERVEQNLSSQVGTLHQSLTAWGRGKRNFVYSWARQPETKRHARIITADKSESLQKLSQFALADYLRPLVSDPEVTRFFLLGPSNRVLASNHDDVLAAKASMHHVADTFSQTWTGMSTVTHPVEPIVGGSPDASGDPSESLERAIYVSSVVQGANGKPLALLVLELDPAIYFYDMFRKSAFSESGEAYAFDRNGAVLTPSVFKNNLFYSVDDPLNAEMLVSDGVPDVKVSPLLARIGNDSSAHHVRKTYIGADGQPKIGAWIWDDQFQMGVVVQQSAQEGLELLNTMRSVFTRFVLMVSVVSLGFVIVIGWRNRLKAETERRAREALVSELDTVHRQNTLEIADREARHKAIIDTAWDAVFTVDIQGVVLSANPAASRIFGGVESRFIGFLLEDFVKAQDDHHFDADYLLQASGKTVEAEAVHRDLRLFPVAVSVGRTRTSLTSFFTVIVRDISEQKASETSLVAARQRLEMSQSFAFIGTWEWCVAHDQVEATGMALKLTGHDFERGAVSLGVFFGFLRGDDRSSLNVAINRSIIDQEPFSVECRITDQKGCLDWLVIQGTPLMEQGRVSRIIGHIQRITKNKQSEEALLETRKMLRLVLDTIPTGVYWKNADLTIAGVNKAFCDDLGMMQDEIIGLTDRDIYNDRDQAMLVEHLDRSVIKSGKPLKRAHARYVMNDGSSRFIEISRLPILDAGGQTLGMLGVYSDITERLETQKSLQRHHQLLTSIYSTQLRYFAGEGREQIFSALLCELLTLTESRSGFVGQVIHQTDGLPYLRMFSVSDPFWRDVADHYYRHALSEHANDFDTSSLLAKTLVQHRVVQVNDLSVDPTLATLLDASLEYGNFMSIPLLKGDQLVGIIGLADRPCGFDRSLSSFLQPMFTTCANLIAAIDSDDEIVATQTQLLRAKNQAEKSSMAKTEFLSRVSHELRTPMNAIMGFTQLLHDTAPDGEQADFLREIEVAGDHLMRLINEVLDLERIESGRIDLKIDQVSLDAVLDESCSVMASMAKEKQVILEQHADNPRGLLVRADAGRIRQIMLNLISNAVKYNRPGGRVLVHVEALVSKVQIRVQDTGIGLTDNEIEHLFESFNRLHAERSGVEGVGMGLVISRHLAELMGGHLDVSSVKGDGSCFTLSIPAEWHSDAAPACSVSDRVLVLSSERVPAEFCSELTQYFERFTPEYVATGIEFLECALQNSYGVLVCQDEIPDLPLDELLGYLADAGIMDTAKLFVVVSSTLDLRRKLSTLSHEQRSRIRVCHKGMLEAGVFRASELSEMGGS